MTLWRGATRGRGCSAMCCCTRNIHPLQRGREPPAPLDSRDWQIARWLLPGVPGFDGSRRKNPLSGVSRWKIFDNLRRSLVPAALTLLLLLGWTVLSLPWLWTLAVIGTLLIPPGMASFLDLFQKPGDVRLRQHLAVTVRSAGQHVAQAAFTLTCLPYEAFFSLDAIVRTAWRMCVTHRRLLEWNPSSGSGRQSRTDLAASWGTMWIAPALAIAAAIDLSLSRPAALTVAGPILALWFASPAIAWWISRPLARRRTSLTADQTLFLRKLSRKTWAFFETFVGPEDHWLPPDNYQDHSAPVVAHRTSPTNMGLATPCEFVRLRLRLHPGRATHRAHGEGLPHHGSPGTPPRPLLQLVRYAVSETAAPHVHFDGGQREPRGPSADLAARSARSSGSPDPGSVLV